MTYLEFLEEIKGRFLQTNSIFALYLCNIAKAIAEERKCPEIDEFSKRFQEKVLTIIHPASTIGNYLRWSEQTDIPENAFRLLLLEDFLNDERERENSHGLLPFVVETWSIPVGTKRE